MQEPSNHLLPAASMHYYEYITFASSESQYRTATSIVLLSQLFFMTTTQPESNVTRYATMEHTKAQNQATDRGK
jgi:hypothetical protein